MRQTFLALASALLCLAPSFAAELARSAPVPRSAAVPAPADLPSLDLTPTPARLETLRQVLTGPAPSLSPMGFQALVAHEPASMAQAMARQKKGFQSARGGFATMYAGLRRVARQSDVPFEERAALAMILADRYASYFDALLREPGFAEPTRRVASRMRDRLRDGSVVNGILYADHVERQATGLSAVVKPALGAAVSGPETWKIPPPVPPSERTRRPGKRRVWNSSLVRLSRGASDGRRELDRRLARLDLVEKRPGFSEGFKAKERARFRRFADSLAQDVALIKQRAQRSGETSIRKTLLKDKDHRLFHVPVNKGLRLIPRRGGFLLKARFKSSIADRRVWEAVTSSIEREWRGRFAYAGKTYYLRTEVSIEPLGAGEKPGTDFLILREGQKSSSSAGPEGISLTRDFDALTPAHEFGHVLGLPDEYKESYDFDAMATLHSASMVSLMANVHEKPGLVLPRHLKLAYQLLRRHRLVRPENPTP